MKYIDCVAAVLLLVGGLNWGLVGLFDFNLVTYLLGSYPVVVKVVYVLVGLAALVKAYGCYKCKCCGHCHKELDVK